MTLKDLVPGGGWQSSDYIKIVGTQCQVLKQCCYFSQADIDKLPDFLRPMYPTTPGWFPLGEIEEAKRLDNEPLPFGTAILAAAAADAIITSNGEVLESETGTITFDLKATEWKYIGNCTPVSLKLKDFTPGGGWQSSDYIKIIGKQCQVLKQCCYFSQADIDKLPDFLRPMYPTTPGWFPLGEIEEAKRLDDEPIPAGSGFLAASAADSTITLPSAL